MLKIKDSKTEVMHFSSKFRFFQPTAVTVGEAVITPVENARNLGVIVDKNLTMDDQLKNVCRSATAALRTIGKIRRYLTKSATQTLIQSSVMSRLDFCNSLMYGLPKNKIRKLQTLQNAAARIISRAPRRHDTLHLLHDLHWLPIEKRIIFKILLITFKAKNDMSPAYISDMISPYVPTRTLRSSAQHLLQVPRHSTHFYGNRAFEVAAPTLWNSLPLHVRQAPTRQTFKTLLKTYLFRL
eukprot:XP_003729125.1 PREDICTED: uncharacterized protein LOC100891250 [Strongylocentrotus purpuratus]